MPPELVEQMPITSVSTFAWMCALPDPTPARLARLLRVLADPPPAMHAGPGGDPGQVTWELTQALAGARLDRAHLLELAAHAPAHPQAPALLVNHPETENRDGARAVLCTHAYHAWPRLSLVAAPTGARPRGGTGDLQELPTSGWPVAVSALGPFGAAVVELCEVGVRTLGVRVLMACARDLAGPAGEGPAPLGGTGAALPVWRTLRADLAPTARYDPVTVAKLTRTARALLT